MFADETYNLQEMAGGVVILAGIVAFQYFTNRKKRLLKAEQTPVV